MDWLATVPELTCLGSETAPTRRVAPRPNLFARMSNTVTGQSRGRSQFHIQFDFNHFVCRIHRSASQSVQRASSPYSRQGAGVPCAFRQDLEIDNGHTYTTALLYGCDYLHFGPGFTPHHDGSFASAPAALYSLSGFPSSGWGPTTRRLSSLDLLPPLLHLCMESKTAMELSSLGLCPVWSRPLSRSTLSPILLYKWRRLTKRHGCRSRP
jgi:hypothetical protein